MTSLLAATVLASPMASRAAAETLQARFLEREAAVFDGATGPRLRLGSGAEIALPTRHGARWHDLAVLEPGWVVAGSDTEPGEREILVVRGDGDGWQRLVAPGGRTAPRSGPRLMADDGHLGGLVWFEGMSPRTHGVRFSSWTGSGWTAPVAIAGQGPGSQLALSVQPLGAGAWLAVWSAFDGQDDEILWSRLEDGLWSAPRRVSADNDVPDITPSLGPTSNGAVLAWSRFDGSGYRIRLARFAEGEWHRDEWFGRPGSLHPGFLFDAADRHDGTTLLHRTVSDRSWSVSRLDGDGRWQATAVAAGVAGQRPLVEAAPNDVLELRWPGNENRIVVDTRNSDAR